MAYVLIEGYMCERCEYRWGSRTGTGMRADRDPKVCPKCKTIYWNRPRTINISPERKATQWYQGQPGNYTKGTASPTGKKKDDQQDSQPNRRPGRTRNRGPRPSAEEMTGGQDGTHEEEAVEQHQLAGRADSRGGSTPGCLAMPRTWKIPSTLS